MKTVTIHEVCDELGVDPTNEQSWSLGSRMAKLHQDVEWCLPPKALRPKRSGKGSHCFAIYPASWRAAIAKAVRDMKLEEGRQGGFDFGAAE
jgi:hypothetical protein